MGNLSKVGAALALASTLMVMFILCAIAQLVLPGAQFSHMWLQLFTAAPMNTTAMWTEGIVASIAVGLVAGWCFAHCYNWGVTNGVK